MTKYILDYYSILNVDETADKKTIEEAYKKSILEYRSKPNNQNKQKEKYIKDAYLVLSDNKKRAKYDLLRKNAQKKKDKKQSEDKEELKENIDKIKDILSDADKKSVKTSRMFGSSAKAMKGKSILGGSSKLLFGNGMKLLVGGAVAGYGAKKGRDFIRGRGKNLKQK